MASSLICEFINTNGTTRSITFGNVDPDTPTSDVKALCNGIVSNSSALLRETFTSAKSAKIRTTTDTEISLA